MEKGNKIITEIVYVNYIGKSDLTCEISKYHITHIIPLFVNTNCFVMNRFMLDIGNPQHDGSTNKLKIKEHALTIVRKTL